MRGALEEVKPRYFRLEEQEVKLPRQKVDKVRRW